MPALFLIIFPELSRVSSRKEEKKVRKREKGVRQEKEKKMEERRRKEEGGKGRKEEREEVRGKEGVRAGREEDGRKKQGFFTFHSHSFSSVQSLSRVQLFATSWTAACQVSLSVTNSHSLLKLMHVH